MTEMIQHVSGLSGRRIGDFLLFGVTSAELALRPVRPELHTLTT